MNLSPVPQTTEQLHKFFPHASHSNVAKYLNPFINSLSKYNITTSARVAAFFAQLEVESGSLHYVEELASGAAYEYREDLGNLDPEAIEAAHTQGSTTGKFYKGHGLIQITGFYNHKQCGKALGIDLVNNPKLLCEPKWAVESAAWYWDTHNCNALADAGLFGTITKVINGGYNGYRERTAAYTRNKNVFALV